VSDSEDALLNVAFDEVIVDGNVFHSRMKNWVSAKKCCYNVVAVDNWFFFQIQVIYVANPTTIIVVIKTISYLYYVLITLRLSPYPQIVVEIKQRDSLSQVRYSHVLMTLSF